MNYQEYRVSRQTKFARLRGRGIFLLETALVCFGAFLMIFPYAYMIVTALKTPQEMLANSMLKNFWPANPNWHVFIDVFTGNDRYPTTSFAFLDSIWNTLKIEMIVIPVGTFFSSLAAFAFAKMKFKGKS